MLPAMVLPGTPREVLLLVVDAGEERGVPWTFQVESLQSVLEPLDLLKRLTGRSIEDTYNQMVRRGRTGFLVPLLRSLQWAIARLRRPLTARLAAYLGERRPAVAVSLAPNFNTVVRDAVRAALPGTPFVLLLTDFADFPPHFWLEPGVDLAVVPTDHAAAQAAAVGIPPERIGRTSGLVLRPRFHAVDAVEARRRLRHEMGFPADDLVLLLLFGGKGAPEMAPLVSRLLQQPVDWRLVAVCGDNPRLLDRLAPVEAASGGRLRRLGFTDRVPELMAAADLLVTKPGPGSLAEAFHVGLPVVVVRDRRTVPQERYNTRLIEEGGLGLEVRHWKKVPETAAALARDATARERVRRSLAALPRNRAVYEVLECLGRTLSATESPLALGGRPA